MDKQEKIVYTWSTNHPCNLSIKLYTKTMYPRMKSIHQRLTSQSIMIMNLS